MLSKEYNATYEKNTTFPLSFPDKKLIQFKDHAVYLSDAYSVASYRNWLNRRKAVQSLELILYFLGNVKNMDKSLEPFTLEKLSSYFIQLTLIPQDSAEPFLIEDMDKFMKDIGIPIITTGGNLWFHKFVRYVNTLLVRGAILGEKSVTSFGHNIVDTFPSLYREPFISFHKCDFQVNTLFTLKAREVINQFTVNRLK